MGKRSHSRKSSETSDKEAKKVKLDEKVSKHKHKHKEKHKKKHKKEKKRKGKKASESAAVVSDADDCPIVYDRLLNDRAKAMAPMTKEEWEKRQSIVRKVFDEETGRTRLVKGDGEILEEIVSKQEHSRINKMATKNDDYFVGDGAVEFRRRYL